MVMELCELVCAAFGVSCHRAIERDIDVALGCWIICQFVNRSPHIVGVFKVTLAQIIFFHVLILYHDVDLVREGSYIWI